MKQLQAPANQTGVSIARTKGDFIRLREQAEPGFDHANLTGAALKHR